jgi:DNA-binding Lrp family transcriptional regulator
MAVSHRPSQEDLLDLIREADEPFVTIPELSEQLPLTREAVRYRMKKLEDNGIVARKKTGARSEGWWLVEA